MGKYIDITGKKFGDLIVLEKSNKRGSQRQILWKCQHVSGKIIYAAAYDLKIGRVTGNKLKGRSKKAAFNRLYAGYKIGAKNRNLSFSLNLEQFVKLATGDCHYCGNEPCERDLGSNNKIIHTNGIDRCNNNKGYTLKNCVTCCKICNKMKMDLDYHEFLSHVTNVFEHQNDGDDSHTRTQHVVERNAGMRGSAMLKHIYDLVDRDNFQKADVIKFLEALVEEHIHEEDAI